MRQRTPKIPVVFPIRRFRWGPTLRLRYFPAMFGRSQFPERILCSKLDISPACTSTSPLDAAPQSRKVPSWLAQKSPDALRCDRGDIRQPTAMAASAPQRPKHSLYCPRAHSYFSLAALNFQKAALPRTEEEFSAEEQLGNDRPNHCYLGGRNDGENTSC